MRAFVEATKEEDPWPSKLSHKCIGGHTCKQTWSSTLRNVNLGLAMSTAKRRKSTVTRPSYNTDRFPSIDKAKCFRESFSSRIVHLERHVQPNTFESIPIRPLFDPLGGDLVLSFSGCQNLNWVREFYYNIEGIDDIGPSFQTWVRSKSIVVTPDLIRELLGIDHVFPEHYHFPV